MTITKLGHCCLLIEIEPKKEGKGVVRIMTDPGNYSTAQNEVKGVDFVIISHEHPDHYHLESVKAVLKNNPLAKIVANKAVAALLRKEGIECSIVGHGESIDLASIPVRGWGEKHAVIYKSVEQVENTGYFIDERFFYPGDALTPIEKGIDMLALPVTGGWVKISEAIEYALAMKPKKCIPVHDGNLKKIGAPHRLPKMILEKESIEFIPLEAGQKIEF